MISNFFNNMVGSGRGRAFLASATAAVSLFTVAVQDASAALVTRIIGGGTDANALYDTVAHKTLTNGLEFSSLADAEIAAAANGGILAEYSFLSDVLYSQLNPSRVGTDLTSDPDTDWSVLQNPGEFAVWVNQTSAASQQVMNFALGGSFDNFPLDPNQNLPYFIQYDGDFGQAVDGTIPEPGSLALVGLALAGLAGAGALSSRRRKDENAFGMAT